MTIFDDIARTRQDPAQPNETAFSYLDRSGRKEAQRVRAVVDAWLDRYPEAHRPGLVARLRSSIDDQHRSAFFELFIHELMLVRGLTVVAIEPPLSHTGRSPDFLIETGGGQRFYLECAVSTGRSQQEAAAQARLNQALAAIDQTSSPAHFLGLKVEGLPTDPLSINRMRRDLSAWIAALPGNDSASETAPFVYEEHSVRIVVSAFARRSRGGRAIGARQIDVRWVTDHMNIREKVEEKATRYDPLDHPYIVAINALSLFADESSAIDALFGSPRLVVRDFQDGTTTHHEQRTGNGVWWGPGGARRQGLSAVFSTEQVDPWNFAARRGRLIRNPWSSTPLPTVSFGVDDHQPCEGGLRVVPGATFGKIFGLSEGWPGSE